MKYTYTIFAVFAALLFIGIVLYNYRFDKRKGEPTPTAVPQNRRERRAAEQKQEQYQQRLQVVTREYLTRYTKFLDTAAETFQQAKDEEHSLTRLTNALLSHLDSFIWSYTQDSRKAYLINKYVPNVYFLAMSHICQLIDQYYVKHTTTSLQSITQELVNFVQKHFLGNSPSEAMQRHKGTVTFNDRNEAMSKAILEFFTDTSKHPLCRGRLLPVDFLNEAELYDPAVVQSHFNRVAIEGSYMEAMETAVRNEDYEKRERANKMMHQNNRQQRAKRLNRQTRRR